MIDKSKTYRTRDGREVRIYATDGVGDQAIHGAVLTDGSTLGTLGGAAVGGIIGHQVGK